MATLDKRPYVRRQYLIKRDLQTKYAFMFVLSIGVGLNLGVVLTLLAPMLKNTSPVFPALYVILVISCVVLVAAISILFTHKIAGPIYKIEKTFRHIIDERDLSARIFLRTGDELQELADEINRLLDHFRNSLTVEHQKLEAILAKLDYLIQQAQAAGNIDDVLIHQLQDVRMRLQDTGLNYKLQ